MIANKHMTRITVILMSIAVLLCLTAMFFSEDLASMAGGTAVLQQYENSLFHTEEIMKVNIIMDENDWNQMLANAIEEQYYQCDVEINNTMFYSVGIRPKGNTSLSSIASDPDNNRYSLKLEFDYYVKGQTCFGLDKLILNNNFADTTNMKEAIIYDMYHYLDADASLYNYAKISVNDEYWGVYLALEAVEDSFLLRNYGVEDGELYKPETMGMGGGDMPLQQKGTGKESIPKPDNPDMPQAPDFKGDGKFPGDLGFHGKEFSDDGGANLDYIDNNTDSYHTIWEGAVNETSESDRKKVITALKNISERKNLENYLDVDNILKYMAVHSFAVNEDSLTGQMAHNYYLYESGGKLNILPWDYNLSFGGMGMGMGKENQNSSDIINDPIDTPFAGTDFFNALLENEEYLARYHEYYRQLVEEYILSGGFEAAYKRIRNQIDSLVETDPNAMYSYDEYLDGVKMLYSTVMLRASSVQGQLNGTIPSTDEGQRANPSALIDSTSIDTSVMGTFSGR